MQSLLTYKQLARLFEYNPKSGILYWNNNRSLSDFKSQAIGQAWNTQWGGKEAGKLDSSGYRCITLAGRLIGAHRIIFGLYYKLDEKDWPIQIDHKDLCRDNNRIVNIRAATISNNRHNSPKRSNNTSGYKGVSFHKGPGKWRAVISVDRKYKHLGYFATPEEARDAYIEAAEELHGIFANYENQ